MSQHKLAILDALTPFVLSIGAITLTDINTLLGTISISVSTFYTLYKIYKERKQ